jgi:hypothetical protein
MPLRRRRRILRPVSVALAILVSSALVLGARFDGAGASTASNKAQAKKDLLVLSDMPSGWKVEKGSSGNGSNNFPGAKQLASCIGVPSKLINSNPPEVDSPYYKNKSGSLEVQDRVSLFATAKVALAELAALANTKTPACMTTIMNGAFKTKIQASAGKGATVGTITVTRADAAIFGKGTTGVLISLPISDQGVSITANILVVYYVKGALGQQIDFNAYGSPLPNSVAKALTTTAINRL